MPPPAALEEPSTARLPEVLSRKTSAGLRGGHRVDSRLLEAVGLLHAEVVELGLRGREPQRRLVLVDEELAPAAPTAPRGTGRMAR